MATNSSASTSFHASPGVTVVGESSKMVTFVGSSDGRPSSSPPTPSTTDSGLSTNITLTSSPITSASVSLTDSTSTLTSSSTSVIPSSTSSSAVSASSLEVLLTRQPTATAVVSSSASSSSSSSSTISSNNPHQSSLSVFIVIAAVVASIIAGSFFIFLRLRRRTPKEVEEDEKHTSFDENDAYDDYKPRSSRSTEDEDQRRISHAGIDMITTQWDLVGTGNLAYKSQPRRPRSLDNQGDANLYSRRPSNPPSLPSIYPSILIEQETIDDERYSQEMEQQHFDETSILVPMAHLPPARPARSPLRLSKGPGVTSAQTLGVTTPFTQRKIF